MSNWIYIQKLASSAVVRNGKYLKWIEQMGIAPADHLRRRNAICTRDSKLVQALKTGGKIVAF